LADPFDPSSQDTAAGFHYAYATTVDGFSDVTYANGSSTIATHEFPGLPAGDHTLYARIIDKDDGFTQHATVVRVDKAPSTTIVTIAGGPFIYDGTAQAPATVTVNGVGGLSLTPEAVYANNVNAGTATASYSFAGDENHFGSSDSQTFQIGKAESTTVVTIVGGPFTYDGTAQTPATVTVSGAGGLSLTPEPVYANNMNAGTATASYSFAGDENHSGSSDSQTFEIAKADATVTVNGYSGVYDAVAHGATGTATGVGGVNLGAGLELGATFIDVPGGTAHWTFAGGTNYLDESGDVAIAITKANATVTIVNYSGTYDASSHSASVTITGVGGVPLASDSVSRTSAGSDSVTVSISDPNYNPASGTATIAIAKADATVSVAGGTWTYDGGAHCASGSVTGVAGDPGAAGSSLNLGASFTNVPGGTAHWTFTGGANYLDECGDVDIVISAANVAPVVTAISNSSPDCGGALQGEPVTVTASFSDAGTGDTHTAVVDWGDGTTSAGTVTEANGSGSVAGSHVYAAGGFYTITVTVTDDGGGSDADTTDAVIGGIGLHDGVLMVIGTNGRDLVHVDDGWWGEIHVAARFNVRDGHHGGHDGDGDGGCGEGHGGWHHGWDGWHDGCDDGCYYATFDASDVTSILIIGCGGDDRLQVSGELSIPASIDGGGGDDAIWGGSGNDTIVDLLGVNEIHAGQGNDSVTVGDGDNRIWTDGGNDEVSAGDGDNEIRAGRGSNVITVGHGANRIWTDGGADLITAGDGDNEIHAGGVADVVAVGDGANRIWTGSGDDTITTGDGDNEIHAGSGNDVISTGSGNDRIWSDGGDDRIDAGGGNDVIEAGAGNDLVRAGAGNDRVQGGAGDDILIGGDGDDLLSGDQGRDLLIGGNGADRIVGNADEDVLIAGWTAYDANDAALLALMIEWTSGARYGTRVANITNGTGSTGGYRLVGDDGPQQTVFNDNEVDQLTGSQGQDWFFANRVADNGGPIDRVLDLAANELWNDTDF
jgi:hypothetical protein